MTFVAPMFPNKEKNADGSNQAIGLWATSTKKEQNAYSYQYQIEKHEPFEQFSYAPQMDYSYAPVVSIDSPGSTQTGATITTKRNQRLARRVVSFPLMLQVLKIKG